MAALKIKHDTVENGTPSQSFKSPVRQLALYKKQKSKKQNQLFARCASFYILPFLRYRKYRLAGSREEKKKKRKKREKMKSFIDLMVGKFARFCTFVTQELQKLAKSVFIGRK